MLFRRPNDDRSDIGKYARAIRTTTSAEIIMFWTIGGIGSPLAAAVAGTGNAMHGQRANGRKRFDLPHCASGGLSASRVPRCCTNTRSGGRTQLSSITPVRQSRAFALHTHRRAGRAAFATPTRASSVRNNATRHMRGINCSDIPTISANSHYCVGKNFTFLHSTFYFLCVFSCPLSLCMEIVGLLLRIGGVCIRAKVMAIEQ